MQWPWNQLSGLSVTRKDKRETNSSAPRIAERCVRVLEQHRERKEIEERERVIGRRDGETETERQKEIDI